MGPTVISTTGSSTFAYTSAKTPMKRPSPQRYRTARSRVKPSRVSRCEMMVLTGREGAAPLEDAG